MASLPLTKILDKTRVATVYEPRVVVLEGRRGYWGVVDTAAPTFGDNFATGSLTHGISNATRVDLMYIFPRWNYDLDGFWIIILLQITSIIFIIGGNLGMGRTWQSLV